MKSILVVAVAIMIIVLGMGAGAQAWRGGCWYGGGGPAWADVDSSRPEYAPPARGWPSGGYYQGSRRGYRYGRHGMWGRGSWQGRGYGRYLGW